MSSIEKSSPEVSAERSILSKVKSGVGAAFEAVKHEVSAEGLIFSQVKSGAGKILEMVEHEVSDEESLLSQIKPEAGIVFEAVKDAAPKALKQTGRDLLLPGKKIKQVLDFTSAGTGTELTTGRELSDTERGVIFAQLAAAGVIMELELAAPIAIPALAAVDFTGRLIVETTKSYKEIKSHK